MSENQLEQIKQVRTRLDLCLSAGNLAWWEMNLETGKVIFNENKVKMLGYSMKEFSDVKYTAFTNLLHTNDHKKVMDAMQDHIDGKKTMYEVQYRIQSKDGTYKWFHDRGSIVERDQNGNPITVKGVVFDITEEKESKERLHELNENLEQRITERTKDLEESNKKLNEEIMERKRTQQYLERTKNNLRNVIDSATEFIISFDVMNRVSIWNKTAEKITKYQQIDVLNRSVGKLNVFNNPEKILEYIDLVCKEKSPKTFDIILKTKDNDTRVIRVDGTKISGSNNDCVGSLFMGKDITENISLHKKLLPGNSYLITSSDTVSSLDLLSELTHEGFTGLLVTRGNPEYIHTRITPSNALKIILLTKKTIPNNVSMTNLDEIETELEEFMTKENKPVILLDGIHYLISRFSFESFIQFLYDINDLILEQKAILFVRIDPSTFKPHEMALIKNELLILPGQHTDDVIIRDDLFEIIKYIYRQNQDNAVVSVKKIMEKSDITYVTAASRIDSLEDKGLIYSKKQGKIRAIFVTEKGKKLIHKRKTA